jgi:flagellar assembly factor FliW
MQVETTRFGSVGIEADDILLFPGGLIGFEQNRHWVLLGDADNPAVGWLQSVSDPSLAVPVISPRRFAPQYRVRVCRSQILPLELGEQDQAYVLAIVSQNDEMLTANLKSPLIINLDRRLGRQVITNDEQPLSVPLTDAATVFRKSA